MKRMPLVLGFSLVLSVAWRGLAADPQTWWVDCRLGDYAGHEGKSEDDALETIQQAVDKAAAGDTIKVKPGTYSTGPYEGTTGGNTYRSLVFINNKANLRVEATGRQDETFILGNRVEENVNDGNTCCVTFLSSPGAVVKGFTIANGGGMGNNGNSGYSGGANDPAPNNGSQATAYVVDCVITNCIGTRGGGARGVNLVRCRLENNKALNATGGNRGGQAASRVNAYFCLFANHRGTDSNYTIDYGSRFVNCTFLFNKQGMSTQFVSDKAGELYNCAFIDVGGWGDGSNTGTAYNCLFGNAQATDCKYADGGGNVGSAAGSYQAKCSAFGKMDARLVKSSYGVGKGKREWLLKIPEGYRDRDLAGRLLGETEPLNIGCYQETCEDYGHFAFNNVDWNVEGYGLAPNGSSYHPDHPYEVLTVTPVMPAGQVLFAGQWIVEGTAGGVDRWVYPELDGKFRFVARNHSYTRTKIAASAAQLVYYAAPDGNDANDGLAPDRPKTLQGAIDAGFAQAKYTLVRAAEGTYDTGTTNVNGLASRVALMDRIRVLGAGMGKSIIKGEADPDVATDVYPYGRGLKAVRCVAMTPGGNTCCIQGFTLQDGHTDTLPEDKGSDATNGGGVSVASANSERAQVVDCEIKDCVASRGGIGYFGFWQRCKMHGNRNTNNSNMMNCKLMGCYLYGNHTANGLVGTGCYAYDCTIELNGAYVSSGNGTFRNCLFVGKGRVNATSDQLKMVKCYAGAATDVDSVAAPWVPKAALNLADEANGDYRVSSLSPILGVGDPGDDWDKYVSGQYDGLLTVNGKPTVGCFQTPLQACLVETATPQFVTITEPQGAEVGKCMILGPGKSLTVQLNSTRKFSTFEIDGTPIAGDSCTLTAPAAGVPAFGGRIRAVVNPELYVDANAANDDQDGLTPETPKKLLTSILSLAIPGDTVHAAAGTYDQGEAYQTQSTSEKEAVTSLTIPARAVIPTGVTLVGDEGAEKTVIRGELSTDASADSKGMGPGAKRCVWMGENTKIKGFTLTDGRTAHPGDAGAPDGADYRGGGILGYKYDSCIAEECIISNCVSKRSGAARNVTYVRCRILDNFAAWNSPAGGNVAAYNTYFDGNRGENTIQPAMQIVNCTYGPSNRYCDHLTYKETGGWTLSFVFSSAATTNIVNSVVASTTFHEAFRALNCVFPDCSWTRQAGAAFIDDCELVADLASRWADWFDAEGRCVSRSFAGVDLGRGSSLANYPLVGDVDLCGGQRVFNATVDAGCCEYDWRVDYAKMLGKVRYLTVTAADPAVRAEDGRVILPAGSGLTAELANVGGALERIKCEWGVSDGGRLSVAQGGVSKDYAPGDYSELRDLAEGKTVFGFRAADADAYVVSLRSGMGFMLLLQ